MSTKTLLITAAVALAAVAVAVRVPQVRNVVGLPPAPGNGG